MTRKALITGISGQDGSYLANFLLNKGYQVFGIERRTASNEGYRLQHFGIMGKVTLLRVDICEFNQITNIIQQEKFDEVYNLAAQSFVGSSWDNPITTSNINSLAVTNLLDAIYRFSPNTRFYQASTSEMFGKITEEVQSEATPFYPRSPYGVSKLYAHWITKNYRESFDLYACSGILFNHESPLRGSEFVTKKIISSLCSQKNGSSEVLELGNIQAKRDWGFAEDYVEAMYLMLQQDKPDDFVIGTGITSSVKDFCCFALNELGFEYEWQGEGLEEICVNKKNKEILIKISEEFFRPAEVDVLIADISKANKILGWKPKTDVKTLVTKMIDYELEYN